jgi:hypothetical protein
MYCRAPSPAMARPISRKKLDMQQHGAEAAAVSKAMGKQRWENL